MTQPAAQDRLQTLPAGAAPAGDVSGRAAALALLGCLALSAGLLAKQVVDVKIPTRDATGYYLPLARAAAGVEAGQVQHPVIPPLYPYLTGLLSRALPAEGDPQERAGTIVSVASFYLMLLLVYLLAARVWSRRAGLAAAILICANPWILRFAAGVGPEMLYGALLALTAWALAHYVDRPCWPWAAAVAAGSGLAPLCRSEGLFVPLLAGLILTVRLLRRPRRPGALLAHLGVLAVVCLAVWWPRMSYMHTQTGYYLLDKRMLFVVPGGSAHVDASQWIPPEAKGYVLFEWAFQPRPWTEIFDEFQESVMMVVSPAAWALALAWWFARSSLPRRRGPQWVLGAIFLAQLAVVMTVKMDRRYVVSIAPLAQVWAGLGALAVGEALTRRRFPRAGAWKCAVILLLVLAAGQSAWSLLMSNKSLRNLELRWMGERLAPLLAQRSAAGTAAPTFLCTSLELPYYAGGASLIAQDPAVSPGMTLDELADLVRTCPGGIDYLIVRTGERWCRDLTARAEAGTLPPGCVIDQGKSGRTTSWLIDARKLFPPTSTQPSPAPPAAPSYTLLLRR